VRAKDAPVDVEFVDDDKTKLAQEMEPAGMVGEKGDMEYIRVAEDEPGLLSNEGSDRGRGIAIVGGDGNGIFRRQKLAQGSLLVVSQGLGGKKIKRPGLRIIQQMVQDGQVITEGFAAGGSGDDDRVLAGFNTTPGGGLVGIKAVYPQSF
jgi:hypothetical protein